MRERKRRTNERSASKMGKTRPTVNAKQTRNMTNNVDHVNRSKRHITTNE